MFRLHEYVCLSSECGRPIFCEGEAKAKSFWKENLIIKVLSQISIFRGEILDLFENFSNSHEKEEFEIQSL